MGPLGNCLMRTADCFAWCLLACRPFQSVLNVKVEQHSQSHYHIPMETEIFEKWYFPFPDLLPQKKKIVFIGKYFRSQLLFNQSANIYNYNLIFSKKQFWQWFLPSFMNCCCTLNGTHGIFNKKRMLFKRTQKKKSSSGKLPLYFIP